MANQEVKITFEIDGIKQEVSSVQELRDEMKKLGKDTKEAGKESTIFTDMKDRFNDATSGLKKVIMSFKGLKGAIAATGIGALIVALGSLISYFQNSEEGSRKLAIATEALGIIWGKITDAAAQLGEKLVWVFENPKEALMNFVDLVKQNIINRFEGLLKLVPRLGEAINQLFKGNFSEAGKIAADAVGQVVTGVTDITDKVSEMGEQAVEAFNSLKEEVNEAVDAATRLVDLTRAIRDQQQALVVDNAKLNKELETQQKIAEDTTLTYDERKTALEAVGEAQIKLAENLAAQARNEEELLRLQIAQEGNYEKREELETQLAEATASRIEAETALELQKQDAAKITRELELEELDRKKAINDMINQLNVEAIDNEWNRRQEELRIAEEAALAELELLKATDAEKQAVLDAYQQKKYDLEAEKALTLNELIKELTAEDITNQWDKAAQELAIQEDKALKELELLGATEEQKQAVRDKFAAKSKKLEQDKADFETNIRKQTTQQSLASASALFGNIAGLVGEGSALGKAAAVAQTTIDTYQSATAAYKSVVGIPVVGPALAPVAAGVAVAGGLMNVKKILSTKVPGKKGGGGVAGAAPTAPQAPAFNPQAALDAATEGEALNNEITLGEQQGSQSPTIKAYVVSSEMTDQQEKDKKINELARL